MIKMNSHNVNMEIEASNNIYKGVNKKKYLFDLFLLGLVVIGCCLKLIQSILLPLGSDSVIAGMVSREFWNYGDILMKDFCFFAGDPYIFTDIIPFHLIPQYLSDFDPIALKISSFFIFILIMVFFSFFTYQITLERSSALLVAALISSGSLTYATIITTPTFHNATLLFLGILLWMIFLKRYITSYLSLIPIILTGLLVFSDSLVLIWFIVPFTVLYVFRLKCNPIHWIPHKFLFNLLLFSSILYFLKNLIPNWFIFIVRPPAGVTYGWIYHLECIGKNLISLFLPISDINSPFIIGLFLLLIMSLLSIYLLSIRQNIEKTNHNNQKNIAELFLQFSFISTSFTIMAVFILAYEAADRYLTIIPILFFCSIGIIITQLTKYRLIVILFALFFIIINLGTTGYYISTSSVPVNQDEYNLIAFMKSENITYAYGDYWDSNVISYLSKEQIIVLPVDYKDGEIIPYLWVADKRWFKDLRRSEKTITFVVRDFNSKSRKITEVINEKEAEKILFCHPFTIFTFNLINHPEYRVNDPDYSNINAIYRILGKEIFV